MATAVKQSAAGNPPAELSSFVGRGRELTEVKRLLSTARVITLTGPGGIGKSRLALRAAHRLGRHFPDGVWWVELAELDSPELVPYALARSLRVQERHDAGGVDDALLSHLRDRRLLLVLDNCEHLLGACRRLVTSVVSGCVGCGFCAPVASAWASLGRLSWPCPRSRCRRMASVCRSSAWRMSRRSGCSLTGRLLRLRISPS